jgi:hypothetical protein
MCVHFRGRVGGIVLGNRLDDAAVVAHGFVDRAGMVGNEHHDVLHQLANTLHHHGQVGVPRGLRDQLVNCVID